MKKYIIPTFILIVIFAYQAGNDEIKSKVDIKQENYFTVFEGICENTTDSNYTLFYSLIIEKTGKSGTSNNKQSGEVKINANKSITCSVVKLILNKGDTCQIDFKVYHNNVPVSKENKVYVVK